MKARGAKAVYSNSKSPFSTAHLRFMEWIQPWALVRSVLGPTPAALGICIVFVPTLMKGCLSTLDRQWTGRKRRLQGGAKRVVRVTRHWGLKAAQVYTAMREKCMYWAVPGWG